MIKRGFSSAAEWYLTRRGFLAGGVANGVGALLNEREK
jgi:hypothetical protein